MKRKFSILTILIVFLCSSLIFAEDGKSVSFIVTGNVRAEFNLCG